MKVHFIGIGGIGVSALAKYYLSEGATISGSDLAISEITRELEGLGAVITTGPHQKENIPDDTSLVIYTAAVDTQNPEFAEAKRKKIKMESYPEAIGKLTKKYKTVTVSGSHGKSTTTALAALVLEEGYFDPTVIVGTKVREFNNSNFKKGNGSYLVLEADEWNESFLHYSPEIALITNIDAEHLDTYKDLGGVMRAFERFLSRVPPAGAIIANADDPNLAIVAKKFSEQVLWFSIRDSDAQKIRDIIHIPGTHNILNALAAFTLGRLLGISESHILSAISHFRGTWRRFEFKGMINGAAIFSDYGHHPSEIHATLLAARERFPHAKIWCVFQPHQHQRLHYLWNEFLHAFDAADLLCLLPVYDVRGRETATAQKEVGSEKLAHALAAQKKDVRYFPSRKDAKNFIKINAGAGDVILVMGAGDIYLLGDELFS